MSRLEKAILAGICRHRRDRAEVDEHLLELGLLAGTAGARVVGTVVQDRGPLHAATLVRRGKVEELAALAREHAADLVIFDEDLSPAQIKNLENEIPVKVLDRSGLILDIFARRARTREARTQVELAQLRYLLPRLTRHWTHLSRQAGGIGQRGVGETQLESDRRLIRHRIARLASELKDIEKARGKSTVMNLLTGGGARVEDRLFVTLDPLVRRCERGGRPPFLVTDTVGFIRKLPHHLVASFRSTLEEAAQADLLVHVIDSASTALEDQMKSTRETLNDLGLAAYPTLLVFNKIDLAPQGVLDRLQGEHPQAFFLSAIDKAQAGRLEVRVREELRACRRGSGSTPAPEPAWVAARGNRA